MDLESVYRTSIRQKYRSLYYVEYHLGTSLLHRVRSWCVCVDRNIPVRGELSYPEPGELQWR
jgi:hypothetical protein